MNTLWMWLGFNLFVLVCWPSTSVSCTARTTRRHQGGTAAQPRLFRSALLFGLGVFHFLGANAGYEFFTGYLIEKSLSVDNIFVFVLIFSHFAVPAQYQHRVLFWGFSAPWSCVQP